MNRSLVLITIGFALSLMLLATVNGLTYVRQNFSCNQGNWDRASNSGDIEINVCTGANAQAWNVQYDIKYNGGSVASGGCNLGPCSDPTAGGISNNSYITLRFWPGTISGIQVFEPDSNGNVQQVWVPYSYSYQAYCNPDNQFCFTPSSQSNDASTVAFTIINTPITINVFFTPPY